MHGRDLVGTAVLAALVACGGVPTSVEQELPMLREATLEYGLTIEPVPVRTATLAWQAPPSDCPHVYRLLARHDPPLLHEGDSISTLAIRRKADDDAPHVADGVPPPPEVVVPLELFYRGFRAEKRGLARDVFVSAEQIGPSAPTAACTPRTWDPTEDAFALGWPKLPARAVAVDETWAGLRVEGRCSRSPCVDPATGGGGPDNHHRTCVSMSWADRLAGVVEIAGERHAIVHSTWTDGHGEQGITTDRVALVSIEHGRPVWARAIVNHAFPQMTADKKFSPVVRTWVLESIDACPGSLAAIGWQRPPDVVADHDRALDDLANIEALRKSEQASKRRQDGDGTEPFAPAGPPT